MQAGTIVASNYLAMAQVLGESFLEHHPDSSFSVLIVDDGDVELPDGIRVVRLGDLDIAPADERLMRTIYDVMEFSTAVKPSFLRHLLAAGGETDAACYLDPDIQVFAPFGPQVDAALEHGIVLTPHVLQPVPRDGLRVDEETIMQSGMYNCGFLAVGPSALPFLDWWDERLRFDALVDFERARFTDQRWVDWVPSLFDFTIERDPGMNVAWWNIHDRPIDLEQPRPTVDGRPLRFVHFSGYDPLRPELLSKHQLPGPRTAHELETGIRTLADAYGERLVELGHLRRRQGAYPWSRSHDGIELTVDVRRLVRDSALAEIERFGEVRSVPDAFDPDVDFASWVAVQTGATRRPPAATATTSLTGSTIGISRTIPDVEEAVDASASGPGAERRAYDVPFDWNDAHGHALRLLLDREPGVVVDLGCGYAPHAEVLRDAGFEFVGLDVDDASLEQLAARGFVARRADLSQPDAIAGIIDAALADLGSGADVVAVMALDVLEHLIAPERVLASLSTWMRQHDGALLVTSVPNVAHRDIAAKLLGGRWDVTPTGLLDHTHLRFFTDASITAVMASAGFDEAVRNDRIAHRSDQRWPAGAAITSPHTPLASLVSDLRDLADSHGDTYQLIRGYRPVPADGDDAPTLIVADPSSSPLALSVIADPSMDAERVALLRTQLEEQTSTDWELLAPAEPVAGAGRRTAALDALVAAASGTYVAFIDESDRLGPRWVEQFVDAMSVTVAGGAPDGDVSGRILRCAVDPVEGADPTSAIVASASMAFPLATVRSMGPGFGGGARPAMWLRTHLLPICGETSTDVPAVFASALTTIDTDIRETGTAETPIQLAPAAAALRSAAELPAVVESLRADVDRLRAENEQLAHDNEWLNAELSPVVIRLVRRALRRDASRP